MARRFDSLVDFTNEVKRSASGSWGRVLYALVPEIRDALDRPGHHITCPFHGGAKDFRVTKAVDANGDCHCTCGHWDGFGLLQKARGWDFPRCVEEVDAMLGGRGNVVIQAAAAAYRTRAVEDHAKTDAEIQTKLQRYWQEAVRLEDPAAQLAVRYFASRGIGNVAGMPDLRFHPELVYYNDESGKFEKHPAILAIARMSDGRVSTLHRTWLTFNGDLPVVLHRKQYTSPSTNPVSGGAIRLFDANAPVLNLAEGLETALSVRAMAPEVPVWSTLNKELLRAVQLPAHVKVVSVFADRDRSYGGQEAAVALVDRLRAEGRKAVLLLPPYEIDEGEKGIDWNDVVRTLGSSAAANHFVVQRWRRGVAEALAACGERTGRFAQK